MSQFNNLAPDPRPTGAICELVPRPRMKYACSMRISLIIVLAGLLSACGFQLRGPGALPDDLKILYVEAPEDLADEVRINLEGSDTRILDQRNDAEVILTLSDPRYARRVLSVDPDTGKEVEFALTYSLNYRAVIVDGKTLLNSRRLVIHRDYVFDPNTVIGKSREQWVLRNEMRRDAIRQILFRLQSAGG